MDKIGKGMIWGILVLVVSCILTAAPDSNNTNYYKSTDDISPPILWDKTFGGSSDDRALSIQETKDGGYIIAGWTGWTHSEGAGNADAWVIKLAGSRGDINGDGTIDISDVILCLRMAIGLDPVNLDLADMNNDGVIDISDVILVLRKAIGLD